MLRVTDHKTGRKPDRIEKVIIGGGAVLQPVLYAMAVEAALGRPVSHGRLFYCTSAGSFYQHPIPLNDTTRAAGLEVLQVIDRADRGRDSSPRRRPRRRAAAVTSGPCAALTCSAACSRKPQDRLRRPRRELRSRP